MKRLLIPAGVLLAVALVAAGCGSTKKATTASATTSASPAVSSAGTLSAKSSSLGTILVDGSGRTLYAFAKDGKGVSNCTGACTGVWPPFTTNGSASAGKGVTASMVTTITRSDGTKQVAYNGHPLYRYSGDSSAGSTTGQGVNGFGAKWYVVAPSGSTITKPASSSTSGGSSNSGGGSAYGY